MVNKPWYIHTMEYCLAIEKNELLMQATWMDLKEIMLNEKAQSQGDILYDFIHRTFLK